MRFSRFRPAILMAGVAATSAFAGAVHAQAPAAAPAAQTPTPPTFAVGPITITGALEANYTVNFNQPYNGNNTYIYNYKEGQVALNLADVRIAKQATPASRIGFLVRPIAGEVARTNFIPDDHAPGSPDFTILEAYGTLLVPFRARDLKVDIGQFVTHVGYETIEVGTNNFFSRNFLFQFPSPFYNAGIRATYPISARTTVTGLILNRYNGNSDQGNRDLAPGFQVVQTLSGTSTLVLNGLYSRENLATAAAPFNTTNGFASSVNRNTGVIDAVYSNQLNPRIKIVGEALYRYGKTQDNKNQDIYGAAGYFIYGFTNGNVAAIRGEFVTQAKKLSSYAANDVFPVAIPGFAGSDKRPNVTSLTASYELRAGIFPGLRTLLEARFDAANERIFSPKRSTDAGKKSQVTLTIGEIFNF